MTTCIKSQDRQEMGEYTPTSMDTQKANAHFLLLQVAPFYIRWNTGKCEYVTRKELDKLKVSHTWATDF